MTAQPGGPDKATSAVAETFWTWIRDGEFRLQQCRGCTSWVWYPRPWCPGCGSEDLRWQRCAGRGRVYTYTVLRRPSPQHASRTPPVLAYVELDEGPRLLTFLRGLDPDEVRVGMTVRAMCDEKEATSFWFAPTSLPCPPSVTSLEI